MKDNEFYFSKSEYHSTGEPNSVSKERKKKDKRDRSHRLVTFFCTAAMIVVVAVSAGAGSGKNSGYIRNAKTGEGISGVLLEFRSESDAGSGAVLATTTTDEEGQFSVSLSDGNYTAYATKNGYVAETIHFEINSADNQKLIGTMLPLLSGDAYTIVLTWGEYPYDLDSHVEAQIDGDDYMHVYYGDEIYQYNFEETICFLDVDVTDSYGPETVTLIPMGQSPYYYYIHNYSGDAALTGSKAIVKVYKGTNLLKEYNIPANVVDGIYWNVFAIKDGSIITKNTVTEIPDVTYAD
jgi:hypothetical protein